MTPLNMMDPISLLIRACNPDEALEPEDKRVVNCDEARHGGIAPLLAKEFRRADTANPLHRLFTGHIGVGKTTELLRLKNLLENPGDGKPRFEVIYFDINNFLDPNDLKLADLLVLIAGQAHDQLSKLKIKGFTATNVFLERFWNHTKQFFTSEVSLSEAEVGNDLGKITAEIKEGDPNNRERLRLEIDKQRSSLRAGVNDLLRNARNALQVSKQACGIVVIVDGLEKLPSDLHEDLFFNGCEQLVGLEAHAVYTVPMQIAYHPRFTSLTQAFAHHPVPVPMIHATKPEGMACLTEMLRKRCDYVNLTLDQVFDKKATWEQLCLRTGGHMRHLMMFFQSALNKVDELPIRLDDVELALKDYRFTLARQITGNLWPWLRRFRSGPLRALPDDLPEEVRRDLLHQLLVFEYINGEPTYDVTPEIRSLANFTDGNPAGQPTPASV
ncbi:MAG: hypothetical protein OJI67_03675 [Prosthecobacter sp.]|nr:hypothetical protein [Prosthecobacter sp.]